MDVVPSTSKGRLVANMETISVLLAMAWQLWMNLFRLLIVPCFKLLLQGAIVWQVLQGQPNTDVVSGNQPIML